MPVSPIPAGQPAVSTFLCAKDARGLARFVVEVFDARLAECSSGADGTLKHGELVIAGSRIMVGESSERFVPTPAAMYVYVPDTDGAYGRALARGATSLMEPADQFYGDRNAGVRDPWGNTWWIATHVEDVPPDEMERRAAAHAKARPPA